MWFSSRSKGTSVALIDISSSSVAGALVRLEHGKAAKPPMLCYTLRVPLDAGSGDREALTAGALRALEAVGDRLVREGAPALRAAVGEGSVDRILVSLGTPWQEAQVETKSVQKDMPFTFTRSFAVEMLGGNEAVQGKDVTRTVIATLLNGYLTADPYGKEAKRAEVIVLTTSIDKTIIDPVEEILQKCFYTRDTRYVSSVESAYRSLQDLYPHEKDFLLLTITNEATEVVSVKRGHLTDTGAISCGARKFSSSKACADDLSGLLREFAARHALPRTIFILAEGDASEAAKEALNDPSLHALWLSDVPLSAVIVQPSQFSDLVKTKGLADGDARLDILALAAARL